MRLFVVAFARATGREDLGRACRWGLGGIDRRRRSMRFIWRWVSAAGVCVAVVFVVGGIVVGVGICAVSVVADAISVVATVLVSVVAVIASVISSTAVASVAVVPPATAPSPPPAAAPPHRLRNPSILPPPLLHPPHQFNLPYIPLRKRILLPIDQMRILTTIQIRTISKGFLFRSFKETTGFKTESSAMDVEVCCSSRTGWEES